jgi:hypothetical protein
VDSEGRRSGQYRCHSGSFLFLLVLTPKKKEKKKVLGLVNIKNYRLRA